MPPPNPTPPTKTAISDALDRLADHIECGHLLLATDGVAFLDAVIEEIIRLRQEATHATP